MAAVKKSETRGDRELLEQFVATADDDAFASLVERHGGMVLGVCERMLGDRTRADDAVQATFVLLARHASRLHLEAGSLAPWLHRVARNASTQLLRSDRARRRREEMVAKQRGEESETIDPSRWAEALPVLDEEIRKLPEQDRTVLVLHYLEDRPQREVADEMGLSYGTLRRRVDRARELLRERLARRGVVVGSALLAHLLWDASASAAVPNLAFKGSDILTSPDLAELGLSEATVKIARKLDFDLRHGLKIKIASASAIVGGLVVAAFFLPSDRTRPPDPVIVAAQPPAPAPEPPAKPVPPAPRAEPREAPFPEFNAFPPPRPEKFHAEVSINGVNRKFDNRTEYEAFMKARERGEAGIAPPPVEVEEDSTAPADGTFEGELIIDGKVRRFHNAGEYENAKKRLLRP